MDRKAAAPAADGWLKDKRQHIIPPTNLEDSRKRKQYSLQKRRPTGIRHWRLHRMRSPRNEIDRTCSNQSISSAGGAHSSKPAVCGGRWNRQTDRRGTVSQTVLGRLRAAVWTGLCIELWDFSDACGVSSTAFQFAIRIDSIRYANRFESILFFSFCKKRPYDSLVVMQFFLLIYCIVSAKK